MCQPDQQKERDTSVGLQLEDTRPPAHHGMLHSQHSKPILSSKKNTFQLNPACLTGIIIMVYYNPHLSV